MAEMKTEFPMTEGVLLLRQGDKTMAIHLTAVTAILEAVIVDFVDPNRGHGIDYSGPLLDHYAVEATGRADRLFLWTGPDPFAKREIRNHVEGIEA